MRLMIDGVQEYRMEDVDAEGIIRHMMDKFPPDSGDTIFGEPQQNQKYAGSCQNQERVSVLEVYIFVGIVGERLPTGARRDQQDGDGKQRSADAGSDGNFPMIEHIAQDEEAKILVFSDQRDGILNGDGDKVQQIPAEHGDSEKDQQIIQHPVGQIADQGLDQRQGKINSQQGV